MTQDAARRITSVDVAREAGLSRTTVSFVLNDTPHKQIPQGTRQRVLDAAARLGYSPSAAARSLRMGRTDVILCLLPDWPVGPNVMTLLESLSNGFAKHGLTFVSHPRAGADQPVLDIWRNMTPAAVLAFGDVSPSDQEAMLAAGTKLTIPIAHPAQSPEEEAYISEVRIGRLQAEHLAAIGHRSIGYAQTDDARLGPFANPRLDGVRKACADLGLDEPATIPIALDIEAAASAIRQWRAHSPPITAVCAYNDEVALALLLAVHSLGLSTPDDLAIVGVDNTLYAQLANLSSVAPHPEILAKYLVRETVRALAGKPAQRRPTTPRAELIRRGST